jgi:threonine/homoserine/homoserine lactone efflux protein
MVGEMDQVVFLSIVTTGFAVAFFHAGLPTHWLPFVVAARAQRWTTRRTLGVTTLASLAHAVSTCALGVVVVLLGHALDHRWGRVFPVVSGGILLSLAAFYLYRFFRASHPHHHHAGAAEKVTVPGLILLLAFSPCEGFLPIYLSSTTTGWSGFFTLSAVLTMGTWLGMVTFTWLSLTGLQVLKTDVFEKYEDLLLGALLLALSCVVFLWEPV